MFHIFHVIIFYNWLYCVDFGHCWRPYGDDNCFHPHQLCWVVVLSAIIPQLPFMPRSLGEGINKFYPVRPRVLVDFSVFIDDLMSEPPSNRISLFDLLLWWYKNISGQLSEVFENSKTVLTTLYQTHIHTHIICVPVLCQEEPMWLSGSRWLSSVIY